MLDRLHRKVPSAKRAVNLSLSADLVEEAKAQGLNLSQFVEEKLSEAVRAERARRWKEENRAAIEAHNEEIRKNGLWAEEFRPW
ncbi:type II toxin-antitoxin system CcdA family antitoxin [Phreatobacter sp.]|uniref:type II toxin-antitoxin system CcdA family antitoxin n=1 Tax=Phreatobacter sp. TaxID=1966341 RepID=UPI0025F53ADE|nr:type II toxin-antitoxin system CcdA family antitoxin [Phreatobacter sp.]